MQGTNVENRVTPIDGAAADISSDAHSSFTFVVNIKPAPPNAIVTNLTTHTMV